MGTRSKTLADRFGAVNQATIDLFSTVPNDALGRTSEAESWTVSAVGAHVASSHDFLVERVRQVVEDVEFQPIDAAEIHSTNANAAEANADLSRDEVIALLRDHGARAEKYVRELSDDDLERSRLIPAMGERPVTAEQVIERVLIGHTQAHLQSLRQTLEQPETESEQPLHLLIGEPAT